MNIHKFPLLIKEPRGTKQWSYTDNYPRDGSSRALNSDACGFHACSGKSLLREQKFSAKKVLVFTCGDLWCLWWDVLWEELTERSFRTSTLVHTVPQSALCSATRFSTSPRCVLCRPNPSFTVRNGLIMLRVLNYFDILSKNAVFSLQRNQISLSLIEFRQ